VEAFTGSQTAASGKKLLHRDVSLRSWRVSIDLCGGGPKNCMPCTRFFCGFSQRVLSPLGWLDGGMLPTI